MHNTLKAAISVNNEGDKMTESRLWLYVLILVGLGFLVHSLGPILLPFLVGALLAYLGDPLVSRLRRWHIPHILAVLIVFLGLFALLLSFVLLMVPVVQKQFLALIKTLPSMIQWVQLTIMPWIKERVGNAFELELDPSAWQSWVSENWQQLGKLAGGVWRTVSNSGGHVVVWVTNIILIPVVTFYLLRDWKAVTQKFKSVLPTRYKKPALAFMQESDEVLSAFFRGQLLVMLGLGIIYSLGLSFIGLQLALIIGVVAGLLSIVPYLGTITGILIALLTAAVQFHDLTHLIYVLIIFAVGHIIEGFVLTPLLVGDRIGLHPVVVIFALLAGGQLFGFTGILLALPVAAVIAVLLRHIKQYLSV